MSPQGVHGDGDDDVDIVAVIRRHAELLAYIERCRKHTMSSEEQQKFWSDQRYYLGRHKPRKPRPKDR